MELIAAIILMVLDSYAIYNYISGSPLLYIKNLGNTLTT
jgi:hypothetical protein